MVHLLSRSGVQVAALTCVVAVQAFVVAQCLSAQPRAIRSRGRAALGVVTATLGSARGFALPLLVPLDIHGFSVSPRGFTALLTTGKGQLLPLPINDVDVGEVESVEALCLLQLLQGIDMGSFLPPERLEQLLPASAAGSDCLLTRVACTIDPAAEPMLEAGSEIALGAVVFELAAEAAGEALSGICATAFEALALAMRYRAPVVVSEGLLRVAGLSEAQAAAAYPQCFTWRDAREQDGRVRNEMASSLSEATGKPVEPSRPAYSDHVWGGGLAAPRELLEKALAIA